MPKPSVVVFDLGKVLVHFDYTACVRTLQSRCTLPPKALLDVINQSPLLHSYESGNLSTPEFFASVRSATGYQGDLAEFSKTFGDIFTPIDSMIALHARLRAAGVTTAVLSNTNELAIRHIREAYPFFANFDHYVLSYEHGAMKPDEKLYKVTEQLTGRRGDALLYLDDRPENIEAGKARGWQTILHHDPNESITKLKSLGLTG